LGLGAWGFGLGAFLLALAPIAAQAPTSTPGLHDGVVVDPASRTAFVMRPEGGIDALDLASGKVRWRSRAAERPLMMVDGLLVAQAAPGERREFVLVALAPAGGAERRRFTVDLPEGVRARVAAGPAQAFKLRTFVTGGAPIVAWTFESRPRRFASIDERHVLVSEPSLDAANWRTPYRWTISDPAGASLGTFDSPVSMAPFIVLGTRLYYVAQPESQRAGAVMAGDTVYRGKMPP
jgi:hypothetical protein